MKTRNHFISSDGYVFKIDKRGFEIECPRTKPKGSVRVEIEGNDYDLLFLMLEYFFPNYGAMDKVVSDHTNDFKIPASRIKIIKFKENNLISTEDSALLVKWRCPSKAGGANSRCADKITQVHVLEVLKVGEFKCLYCGDTLDPKRWHLDHFHPIAHGGKNHFSNLVAACRWCNIMKSTLDGYGFIRRCKKIVLRHRLGIEETRSTIVIEEQFTDLFANRVNARKKRNQVINPSPAPEQQRT